MTDAMNPMDEIERFLSMHADQLLAGEVASEDLPDEVVGLAGLFTNLRTAIDTDDADSLAEARAVATIAARIRSHASHERNRRGVRVLGRRVTARAAAVGLVAVLASGGAAAAATGALPDSVQSVVSHALKHFHISVPDPREIVDVPVAVTHDTEPASREPSAAALVPATANETVPAAGGESTARRAKRNATLLPAHPSATPTTTGQPNVAPTSTSLPGDGSSTPADPPPNGNPNANGHAAGNANGSANGHAPADGKAKGNASGSGKTTGTTPGNGKAKGNGNPNGNGNANPPGSGNPPGQSRKAA